MWSRCIGVVWSNLILYSVMAIVDRRGVTAVEYALIAALIAVAAIAAFTLVGTRLSTTFSTVGGQL